jgi:hypothetical protein
MKSPGALKHFFFVFLIALAVYLVFYKGIEHLRTRHGPWEVAFINKKNAVPTLVINQPSLRITNLSLSFPGATAPPAGLTMRFDQPQQWPFDVPFGQCVFEDTTFQPGTVVFKMFGHEIQLLPRTLTIDKIEQPWISNTNIALRGTP